MLKYAGIIFISVSISMYGAYLSNRVKERKEVRNALLELLVHIKRSIDSTSVPLYEIYKSFSSKTLEKTDFLNVLSSGEASALLSAIDTVSQHLNEKLKETYISVASSLGKSCSAESESQKLASAIMFIKEEGAKLDKEDDSKRELYRRLGVLCGLLAAVILL